MNRKSTFLSTLLLTSVVLLLSNCGQTKGSGGNLNGDGGTSFGGGSAGGSGTKDMGGAMDGMQETVSAIKPETPAEEKALAQTTKAIDGYDKAYEGLDRGDSPAEINAFIRQMIEARRQAEEAARLLETIPRLAYLADIFRELARKVDVLRFYNANGDHFFTTSNQEGFIVQVLGGYKFEGIAFRAYRYRQNTASKILMQCRYTVGHFLSNDPNCEGHQIHRRLGFLEAAQSPEAIAPLARLINSNGYHHATASEEERKMNIQAGWRLEGFLGFTPN